MKKRTSRLLSVLLTLVMVLGLLPALGTTALADERFDLYLEVGENAFDKPEIQSIIYKLTGQRAKGLGPYTVPRHDWSDDLTYYVVASSSDDDIISDAGLAKRSGECLLNIKKIDRTWGQSDKILDGSSVLICVTNARIDRVAVTGIDAPVTGQPLDMTAECSTPGIASATVEWYNSTDGVDVVSGAVAQGGKAYSAFVTVTPASGYELVGYSTTKVTVNGGSASSVYGGTDYLTVAYHFPATGGENSENQNWVTTKKIISEVAITGVVTPVDGAKPVETCKLGGTGYTLKSMSWYDGSLKMNSAGIFQAGKTYRVCFYLLPEKGYTFDGVDSMTATVNGKTVEVTNVYGEPEQRGVTIDFTCEKPSKTISTVDITELDALKAGAPAITTQPKSASVKEGADVTFSVAAEGEGLSYQWYCESKGSAAKVGTNGPTYTIKVVNVPDDNGTAYYCVVSNKAGEVTSDKATLTVSKLGAMTTFSDVPEGAYYTDAVAWAIEKGVTSGTSATTFSPNATCTRAQTVTFLWRSQKSPADGAANSFTDVADGTCYTDAVKWAVKKGVTSGTSATTFSPNADCSRAQIVTFLYRCLGK